MKICSEDIEQVVSRAVEGGHAKELDVIARSETDKARRIDRAEDYLREQGYDDECPYNFRLLASYLAHMKAGIGDKGMCVLGGVGIGKTFGMRIIARALRWKIRSAQWIVAKYGEDRDYFYEAVQGYHDGQCDERLHLVVDDLGSEPTGSNYGPRLEILDFVISLREDLYQQRGLLTSITSNLDEAQLTARYGARIISRIKGLCSVIVFEGRDRRRTGNEEFLP